MTKHVLIPVDRSPHSENAFEYVLAEMAEPTITLLHVIDPVAVWGYGDDDSFDLDGYRREEQRRREQADQLLSEYRNKAMDRGLRAETVVELGKPSRRILEAIEEFDIDHIVMGSRGRSGIGRVLLGSVAETVMRRSSVPVTIVR